jgi:long-chain acyl-CoA synthetase
VPTRTILQVLADAARVHGEAAALRQPAGDGYRTLSWREYLQAVTEIAAGLRSLGIAKGDVVALNSETRLEFYLADLGIMANGSIAAALYLSQLSAQGSASKYRTIRRLRGVRGRSEDTGCA